MSLHKNAQPIAKFNPKKALAKNTSKQSVQVVKNQSKVTHIKGVTARKVI